MQLAIFCLTALSVTSSFSCFSQGRELTGTVRKHDGCVIADAQVEVFLNGKCVLSDVESNSIGNFFISNFHSGEYQIRIHHSAFSKEILQIIDFGTHDRVKKMEFVFEEGNRQVYPSVLIPCEDSSSYKIVNRIRFRSYGKLWSDPPFYTPSAPGNQTTILAEDLEHMPY